MNSDRLNDLLAVVRDVPDEQFDMTRWWQTNCKTVGCAVGNYIHARPRCGLRLKKYATADDGVTAIYGVVGYGRCDWSAIEQHFELSLGQASHLFSASHYDCADGGPTKANVIARIEEFIAKAGV